jgi:5-methylthioadenosine/S-adenosylhomocysteine deaminase
MRLRHHFGHRIMSGVTVLLASLLAACSAVAPVSVPAPASKPAANYSALVPPQPPDPGILLSGRVVTMNDAGEVIPNGRVWIRGGKIEAVLRMGDALPAAAQAARVVYTRGAIYPGMIDLHNHPEYAHYPLLPITRKYRDRYEWRWYDDDYNKRITFPQQVLAGTNYYDLGLEIGRYGEYKALVGGTTSLQGGRFAQPYAASECLVRNIETTPIATRLAFSRVDIGRDAEEWKKMQDEYTKGILVVHLAEGPSTRMADEFRYLKQSGLLGPNLIAIHGVGLTEPQLKEMAQAKAKLVWSPLSNFILYGKTANVDAAHRAGVALSIAPDWTPSGSKSILGELKAADLVNKHELKMPFTDRELVEMVTRRPAEAMNWGDKLGQITPGFLADMIVVDDKRGDVYRNLIDTIEENIQLVVIRGEALYGDAALLRSSRVSAADIETVTTFSGKREKSILPNCPGTKLPNMSLHDTMARLQEGMNFDFAYTAKRVSIEQFTRDLTTCGLAKPSDPPTADDAKRLLSCRFGLPFEATKLSPLTTNDDADFFVRLMANPNLPPYIKRLPDYYRAP